MERAVLPVALGLLAALADVFGGLVLVRAHWEKRYLRYFVALGAGFMLSAAFLEMLPESFAVAPRRGALLVFFGFSLIHLIEHTVTPHFHFGEETHHEEFVSQRTSYSVVGGLAVHSLFDGVAIASGFTLSNLLGWVIFFAIFLHKVPEGFTVASVMLASGRSRRSALISTVVVAVATVGGALLIAIAPSLVRGGLPISAGVAIYVAGTDLLPETNREPGIRMALVFFGGVALFFCCEWIGRAALR